MEVLISDDPQKLILTVDGTKQSGKFFLVLLSAVLILAILLSSGEVFLGMLFLMPSFQVTELHFNKEDKTVYVAYSFFGKILKKSRRLDDYTAYTYSIGCEVIEEYELYTIRATGYYYYYDVFQFRTRKEAELVGSYLTNYLGIEIEEPENPLR